MVSKKRKSYIAKMLVSCGRFPVICCDTVTHHIYESHFPFTLLPDVLLSFSSSARTAVCFICAYIPLGLLFSSSDTFPDCDENNKKESAAAFRKCFELELEKLATSCILDVNFKSIQASATACAIIYHLRTAKGVQPVWTPALTRLTFHDPAAHPAVRQALNLLVPPSSENASPENFSTSELDDEYSTQTTDGEV